MRKLKKNVKRNEQFNKQNVMKHRKQLKIIELLKIKKLFENSNDQINPMNSALIGARYIGKNESDGKRILNKSQNGISYPYFEKGFPRAHASYKKSKSNSNFDK